MTIPVTSADSSEADNNGDDDDDDDDDDDVLPRYRVIDIPLSIRAQAYLSDGNEQEKKEKRVEKAEGIKDKSNIGNQSSGGALVLYSPRPSSWSWSPPPNSSKRDDSQTEDAIGAAHFTLPRSPSPSFMDID
ncbi:hypothetical protein GGI07_000850 [Coemansia sp. Benny D115]|nr:hypothetical protein GGI07_000850 [Coemansia sp. Benny D115]